MSLLLPLGKPVETLLAHEGRALQGRLRAASCSGAASLHMDFFCEDAACTGGTRAISNLNDLLPDTTYYFVVASRNGYERPPESILAEAQPEPAEWQTGAKVRVYLDNLLDQNIPTAIESASFRAFQQGDLNLPLDMIPLRDSLTFEVTDESFSGATHTTHTMVIKGEATEDYPGSSGNDDIYLGTLQFKTVSDFGSRTELTMHAVSGRARDAAAVHATSNDFCDAVTTVRTTFNLVTPAVAEQA